MVRYATLCTLLTGCFFAHVMAQTQPITDTLSHPMAPVFLQTSLLFSLQEVGAQVGLGALVSTTERHVFKKSGREKVIFKDRILSVTPGFYYQKYLHTNLFLTVDYAFIRRHSSGFYGKVAPFLGVSRTFLNAATYTVDDKGIVNQDKTAGDWRATAGFTLGIGKRFDTRKASTLRDIYLTLNVPFYYPNFRSVALKPSLQLGVSFNLNRFRHSFSRTIQTIHR